MLSKIWMLPSSNLFIFCGFYDCSFFLLIADVSLDKRGFSFYSLTFGGVSFCTSFGDGTGSATGTYFIKLLFEGGLWFEDCRSTGGVSGLVCASFFFSFFTDDDSETISS